MRGRACQREGSRRSKKNTYGKTEGERVRDRFVHRQKGAREMEREIQRDSREKVSRRGGETCRRDNGWKGTPAGRKGRVSMSASFRVEKRS